MFISKNKEGSLYYQPKQSQIPRHPVIPSEVNGVLGMCLGSKSLSGGVWMSREFHFKKKNAPERKQQIPKILRQKKCAA